jgi:hypothetical protein
MTERPVEPFAIARLVESYVDDETRSAAKYTNRSPLDDSGVYSLHVIAARIFALGFHEGVQAEGWRQQSMRSRERDAQRAAAHAGQSA